MAVRSLLTKLALEVKRNHQWRPISYNHRNRQKIYRAKPNIDDKLATEILKLEYPSGCVKTVVQRWFDNGDSVSLYELRRFSSRLVLFRRYNHSLQLLEWLETRVAYRMSPEHYADKMDLTIQVRGLNQAEEYFDTLSGSISRRAAYPPLLQHYVRVRETEKAEAFMGKLNGLGMIVTPHPYNEMMKLYSTLCQFEKVGLVIREMKRNGIPLVARSYNIWMNACWKIYGIESVEKVYEEMLRDKNLMIGWSSLASLANAYTKSSEYEKANLTLKDAEEKLTKSKRLGYLSLMKHHAALGNHKEVLRLWEVSKEVQSRITCEDYLSAMWSFVKLGEFEEAEKAFVEWESDRRSYDIRLSNLLLRGYARRGLMEKAEVLHLRTLEGGGTPDHRTWETFTEGWVKAREMDKAISAAKKLFSMLKQCQRRPSDSIVMSIADCYEQLGDIDGANQYVETVSDFGFASLPLYKSLLRIHHSARKPALSILDMMEKDKIEMDDEACALVRDIDGSCVGENV